MDEFKLSGIAVLSSQMVKSQIYEILTLRCCQAACWNENDSNVKQRILACSLTASTKLTQEERSTEKLEALMSIGRAALTQYGFLWCLRKIKQHLASSLSLAWSEALWMIAVLTCIRHPQLCTRTSETAGVTLQGLPDCHCDATQRRQCVCVSL